MTANHVQSVQESRLFRFNLNDSQSPLTFAGQRMDEVYRPYTTATGSIINVNSVNSVNSIQSTQQATFTPVNIKFDSNWLNTNPLPESEIDNNDESNSIQPTQPLTFTPSAHTSNVRINLFDPHPQWHTCNETDTIEIENVSDFSETEDESEPFDFSTLPKFTKYNKYSQEYFSSSSFEITGSVKDLMGMIFDINTHYDCLYNYIFSQVVKDKMWHVFHTWGKSQKMKPVFSEVLQILKESEKYDENDLIAYGWLCEIIYNDDNRGIEIVLNYAYDCLKKSDFNDIYYAICTHIEWLWNCRNSQFLTLKNKTTLVLLYAKTHGVKLFQFISLMRVMDTINMLYDNTTEMNAETMFMAKHITDDFNSIKNINKDIWYYLKNDAFKFNHMHLKHFNHNIRRRVQLNEEIKSRNPISPITPEKIHFMHEINNEIANIGNGSHLYTRCILDDAAYDSLFQTLIEDVENRFNETNDEKYTRMRMEINANLDNRSIIIKRFIAPFVLGLNREKIIKNIHDANEMIKMIKHVRINNDEMCEKYSTWRMLFDELWFNRIEIFSIDEIDRLKMYIEDMKRALSFWY
jgi:hypothetical protein